MDLDRVSKALIAWVSTILLATSAQAEIREFGWYGTVRQIDPAFAASLPAGSNVVVGSPALVRYEFETTTTDQDPTTNGGNYVGALTSFSIRIGTLGFTRRLGGASNSISILADSFFRFYEAVTTVDPSSPIANIPELRGDVFFEPQLPTQIASDDLLLTVPDPDAWSTAASGLLNPTGAALLDIDLLAVCVGTCQSVPEPDLGLAFGSGILLIAGFGRRCRTRA
jgi:hypothetical protein